MFWTWSSSVMSLNDLEAAPQGERPETPPGQPFPGRSLVLLTLHSIRRGSGQTDVGARQ